MCDDTEQFGSLGVPAPVCHHPLVIAVSCHPTAPTLIFRDHVFLSLSHNHKYLCKAQHSDNFCTDSYHSH